MPGISQETSSDTTSNLVPVDLWSSFSNISELLDTVPAPRYDTSSQSMELLSPHITAVAQRVIMDSMIIMNQAHDIMLKDSLIEAQMRRYEYVKKSQATLKEQNENLLKMDSSYLAIIENYKSLASDYLKLNDEKSSEYEKTIGAETRKRRTQGWIMGSTLTAVIAAFIYSLVK